MYNEVRSWMIRNARAVELALWRYHFENGNPKDVADALLSYQNEDGGFGHALEPDCWNPGSTPVATWTAIKYMLAVGFDDMAHPAYQGVWRYLASGKDREAYGWRFSVPENDNWPRAPWWSYGEANNRDNYANVTVGLTAFILRYGKDEALLAVAEGYAKQLVALLMDKGAAGEALEGYDFLLEAMAESGMMVSEETWAVLRQRQNAAIGREVEQWKNYVPRPSRFIHDARSPLYKGNEAIVQAEVDYLKEIRQAGGVWPITWTWFDMMPQYGAEFAISERWWQGLVAIENMLFLRAFDKGE